MMDSGNGEGAMWAPENAGMLWAILWVAMLAFFVFYIFLQWKIFAKAGYSGALALINLAVFVPLVGPLIVLGLQAWFAFAKWPALNPPPQA